MFRRRSVGQWATGTYTDWRWPVASTGYTRFDWSLVPETDPTPDGYFWSHQFGLVDGKGGYLGLQTLGSDPAGKIAIFSIWGAESAEGPSMAGPFGGEGTGQTARIPYQWRPTCAYYLSVSTNGGGIWAAHVADASGDERLIGRIRVPIGWGGLSDFSIMWTERYSGSLRSCADIRRSAVRFITPVANRKLSPLSHYNHLGEPPGCPGSHVQDVPGGVVQVMGENGPSAVYI